MSQFTKPEGLKNKINIQELLNKEASKLSVEELGALIEYKKVQEQKAKEEQERLNKYLNDREARIIALLQEFTATSITQKEFDKIQAFMSYAATTPLK